MVHRAWSVVPLIMQPTDRTRTHTYARAQIPEMGAFKVGIDAGLDPARNHDYAIVGDFASEADYAVYASHPLHVAVIVEHIKPVLAAGGRVAVQYVL